MAIISLIVIIDENNGMGKNNKLLCHLPADLKHFKALTIGKPIIMGRKTFESIGQALPNRLNIVLTRQQLVAKDILTASSIEEAIKLCNDAPEVMVIGGGKVFQQFMHTSTRVYLTKIHHKFSADVFFPALDENIWKIKSSNFRHHDEKNAYDITFLCFEKELI